MRQVRREELCDGPVSDQAMTRLTQRFHRTYLIIAAHRTACLMGLRGFRTTVKPILESRDTTKDAAPDFCRHSRGMESMICRYICLHYWDLILIAGVCHSGALTPTTTMYMKRVRPAEERIPIHPRIRIPTGGDPEVGATYCRIQIPTGRLGVADMREW